MDCGPFFFRARAVWMDLHDGAVQPQGLHFDPDDLLFLQRREDAVQDTRFRPPVHPRIDRVPPAKPLGERPPLAPVLGHIQNGVQHVQVGQLHVPALRRKTMLNPPKLLFRDCHASR
jgi:hypothetical protein